MVSKQKLATVIGEVSGSNLLDSVKTGYAKSDEHTLQAQTQAFMTMFQKMKMRQDELETQLKTQQDILDKVNDEYDSKLEQKYVNMKHAMKVFKAEVSVRLEKKEDDYTNII